MARAKFQPGPAESWVAWRVERETGDTDVIHRLRSWCNYGDGMIGVEVYCTDEHPHPKGARCFHTQGEQPAYSLELAWDPTS